MGQATKTAWRCRRARVSWPATTRSRRRSTCNGCPCRPRPAAAARHSATRSAGCSCSCPGLARAAGQSGPAAAALLSHEGRDAEVEHNGRGWVHLWCGHRADASRRRLPPPPPPAAASRASRAAAAACATRSQERAHADGGRSMIFVPTWAVRTTSASCGRLGSTPSRGRR